MRRLRVTLVLLCALLLTACSNDHSVLTAGYERFGGKTPSPSAAKARAVVRANSRNWQHEIATRGRRYPSATFDNFAPKTLKDRLAQAAEAHHFAIVSVKILRPWQLAPHIVITTTHYLELAHALRNILARIDPRMPAVDDRQGWAYEAFYLEARDEKGVPFLAVFNYWRGPSAGGGQWARSEPLYPFIHG